MAIIFGKRGGLCLGATRLVRCIEDRNISIPTQTWRCGNKIHSRFLFTRILSDIAILAVDVTRSAVLRLSLSLVSTSTLPVPSSSLTTASLPCSAAHDSGVWPASSLASASALSVPSSSLTIASCPFSAANNSGVWPYLCLVLASALPVPSTSSSADPELWRGRLYLATAPIGSLTGAGFRFGSTTGYESYAQALRSTQLHSVLRGHLFESQHGQTIRAVEGSVVK